MERYEFERLIQPILDLERVKLHQKIQMEIDKLTSKIENFNLEKEEVRYDNLSFSQALEYLKQGKKVKRKHWGGFWFIDDVELLTTRAGTCDEDENGYINNLIVARLAGEEIVYVPATPYQGDLLANDWEVVE